jgi:hypothetical protein
MPETTHAGLGQLLNDHQAEPAFQVLHETFIELTSHHNTADHSALINLYQESIRALEAALPVTDFSNSALDTYQQICRELEALIASQTSDDRHNFLIIIPTADRPLHIEACLNSLLELCQLFDYGGSRNGRYRKIRALIADDSKDAANIAQHRQIAWHFNTLGLETEYFGLAEQIAELDKLPGHIREKLGNLLGHTDRTAFYHKGHSVMRNIIYLHLNTLPNNHHTLFYFADSDQEFKVKTGGVSGDRDVYALNYFYHLDRIFNDNNIRILTGKVVGDPPVSPAVMAGNFLDDVRAFLTQLDGLRQDAACPFHDQTLPENSGAAYHDMSGLFGFHNSSTHNYRCTLHGQHNISDCLNDFTQKLSRFFDGEHPTRITYFDATEAAEKTSPARTLYTGNYVMRAAAVHNFIAFAPLRLRMSGPTLGRIFRAEIGTGFVSANLPMLHKRTVDETGESEFRPGIHRHAQHIDIANEFERQFFGDIMLFTMEKITARGYPAIELDSDDIAQTLDETLTGMMQRYQDKHVQIMEKITDLQQLRQVVNNRFTDTPDAWSRFDRFLNNMTHNFGAQAEGYRLITDTTHCKQRLAQLQAAIMQYHGDRDAWEAALSNAITQANPANA